MRRLTLFPRLVIVDPAQDVDDAVTAAKAALSGDWGESTVAERADLLEAIAAAVGLDNAQRTAAEAALQD